MEMVEKDSKRAAIPSAAPLAQDEPPWMALAKKKAKAWSEMPQIVQWTAQLAYELKQTLKSLQWLFLYLFVNTYTMDVSSRRKLVQTHVAYSELNAWSKWSSDFIKEV